MTVLLYARTTIYADAAMLALFETVKTSDPVLPLVYVIGSGVAETIFGYATGIVMPRLALQSPSSSLP